MNQPTTALNRTPGPPQNGRSISVAVSPKCGCLAVRHWLYELGIGKRYDGKRRIFEVWPSVRIGTLRQPGELRVAIHRDGVGRMRSAFDYLYRIGVLKPERTLEWFAKNLPRLAEENGPIWHHTRPQWHWLGPDPEAYDIVLRTSDLYTLPNIARRWLGEGAVVPDLRKMNSTGHPTEVSNEARQWLAAWTGYDDFLGWDGERISGLQNVPQS